MHYTEYKQSDIDERNCPVLYDTTKNSYRTACLYCIIDASRPELKEFSKAACSNKYILLGAEGRAANVGQNGYRIFSDCKGVK
jgi:hypothetical protein